MASQAVGLYVNTYGTSKIGVTDGEIANKIAKIFDMRPYFIEQRFSLRTPIYAETAAYGHMGREPKVVVKTFNEGKKTEKKVKVELFPWEKLDDVDQVKKGFQISSRSKIKKGLERSGPFLISLLHCNVQASYLYEMNEMKRRTICTCIMFCVLMSAESFGQTVPEDTTRVLNEIVVQGYLYNRPLNEVPASIAVLREQDFERFSNTSVLPVFNTIPASE